MPERTESTLRFTLALFALPALLLACEWSAGRPSDAPPTAASIGSTASRLSGMDPELSGRVEVRSQEWTNGVEGARTQRPPGGLHGFYSRLPATSEGAWEVGVGESPAHRLSLAARGASPASSLELDGKRAVYPEMFRSTDAVYVNGPGFAELLLVLRDAQAPAAFEWEVRLPPGLEAARPDGDGGLEFVDGHGSTVLRTPRPFSIDARGTRRAATLDWDGARLSIRPDLSGAEFPVLLDPVFEASEWIKATEDSSLARCFHAMAPLGNKVVLFGGYNGGMLGDTREWDGSTWSQRFPGNSPFGREVPAMATLGTKVVLFGGVNGSGFLGDTWEWDGTTWKQRAPQSNPPARGGHAMATLGDKVVLFGGNNGAMLGDTWEWDGSDWTQKAPAASPSARQDFGLATLGSKVVLFGGKTGGTEGDTWEWDGTTWTQKTPIVTPPARSSHAMASAGTRVAIFGGHSASGFMSDTWEWDGTNWMEQSTSASPSARQYPVMVSLGDRALLFGGVYYTGTFIYLGDTWNYRRGRTVGSDCTDSSECMSGLCVGQVCCAYFVDGVCCDTACGGGDPNDCQACSVAAGAAADGTCGPRAFGVECRPSAGDCDPSEVCDGTALACPANARHPSTHVCREAVGPCDLPETCVGSGTSCPIDAIAGTDVVCRLATGDCDLADHCSGTAKTCPADALAGSGTTCRPGSCAAGQATLPASCTSASKECPAVETQACGDFACGATACLTQCSRDEECADGRRCRQGQCTTESPTDAGTAADVGAAARPDGGETGADAAGATPDAGRDAGGGSVTFEHEACGCAASGNGTSLLGVALAMLALGRFGRRRA